MAISAQQLALQIGILAQRDCTDAPLIILIGPPGGGKTAYAESLSRFWFRFLAFISCAQTIPETVGGLPVADLESSVVRMLPMAFFEDIIKGKPGESVFILDEIADGSAVLQGALHRLITHGEVGTSKLPERTALIGMCNPPDQATTGGALSEPMATRACQIPWTPFTVKKMNTYRGSYMDILASGEPSPDSRIKPEMITLPKGWQQQTVVCNGIIEAFLERNGDCASNRPKPNEMLGGMVLGSSAPAANSRTWLYGNILLGAARALEQEGVPNAREAGLILLSGCVGEHIATQYFAFEANFDLPDPAECLRAPPLQVGRIFAEYGDDSHKIMLVCKSAAMYAIQEDTPELIGAAWKFLGMAAEVTDEEDMVLQGAIVLCQDGAFKNPGYKKYLKGRLPDEMTRWAPLLKDAGMLSQ